MGITPFRTLALVVSATPSFFPTTRSLCILYDLVGPRAFHTLQQYRGHVNGVRIAIFRVRVTGIVDNLRSVFEKRSSGFEARIGSDRDDAAEGTGFWRDLGDGGNAGCSGRRIGQRLYIDADKAPQASRRGRCCRTRL